MFVNGGGGSGFRDGLKEQFVSVDVTPSHLLLDSFLSFLFFLSQSFPVTAQCCVQRASYFSIRVELYAAGWLGKSRGRIKVGQAVGLGLASFVSSRL